MSELAQVVAYVFTRHGRATLGRNEFKQFLAFRAGWYSPSQAAQLLDRALQAGLLVEEAEQVRPGFDLASIELPMTFRGTPEALEGPVEAPALASAPAPAPPPPVRDAGLEERVAALQGTARGALSGEVARLVALRERGEDVRGEAARRLSAMIGQNHAA